MFSHLTPLASSRSKVRAALLRGGEINEGRADLTRLRFCLGVLADQVEQFETYVAGGASWDAEKTLCSVRIGINE